MPRRLLLVHAHPDDETINNGATMARYVAEGAQVTLVTCTRGEQGEVIPSRLAHLFGDGPALGQYRSGELAAAMAALGVTDHRFLGEPDVVHHDSGMAYDHEGVVVPAPTTPEGAFAVDDVEKLSQELARILLQVCPDVVVTYEPGGGYGHPDHVRAHEITMRAVELAAVDGFDVPKVYWIVMPQSLVRAGLELMAGGGLATGLDPHGRLPSMVVPDELVTTCVDATAYAPAKVAALRAHETQVAVTDDGAFFALSNGFHQPVTGLEYYRLAKGTTTPPYDDLNRETTLFTTLPDEIVKDRSA